MMRLCVKAIGEAVNTTAAAQQTNAAIRPRTRGNEDWLAVLMIGAASNEKRERLRRGNYATSVGTLSLAFRLRRALCRTCRGVRECWCEHLPACLLWPLIPGVLAPHPNCRPCSTRARRRASPERRDASG